MSPTPVFHRRALAVFILASLLAGCGGDRGASDDAGSSAPEPADEAVRFAYESQGDPGDARQRPADDRPNILLITLDTARRDRFSTYGYPRGTTPNIDRLASESIVFEDCVASQPVTLPSHATILTGLEPPQHGVRNNGSYVLAREHETLAEALRDHGYATGAVIAAYPLLGRFGLDQGFDAYDDTLTTTVRGTPVPQRVAEQVTPRGLDWIRAAAEPWFLWIHYFDPHEPYTPPQPYAQRFPGEPYDGEMAYMDAHVGGLLRELSRMGLRDATMIALTADHGEGLGDHNEPSHSLFLYSTTMDAPLVLKFPRGDRWDEAFRSRRVGGLVATTDIAPTLMDVAGIPAAERPELSGSSLIPKIRDGEEVRETAYMETLVPELDYGWSPYFGLRMGPWKLILGPNPELYRVDDDPAELVNLYAREKDQAAKMQAALLEMSEDGHLAATIPMDQETVEALRSLGYAGGGGVRARGDLKDTKEMLWAMEDFDEARAHMSQGDMQSVIDVLSGVLARDATNRFAMRMLSYALIESGYSERGIRLSRRILSNEPDAADAGEIRLRMANALVDAGRAEEAAKVADVLLEADPPPAGAHLARARALAAQGDMPGARRAIADAEEYMPGSPDPHVTLAEIFEDLERWDDAERAYLEGVALHPTDPRLRAGLAGYRIQQGEAQEAADLLKGALEIDPTNARANFHKGQFEVRAGKPQEAMVSFQKAVKKEPGNVLYRTRLGNHCLAGRLYDGALEHLGAALERGAESQEILAGIGISYARLNRTAEARETLERALALDTKAPLADDIREELNTLGP